MKDIWIGEVERKHHRKWMRAEMREGEREGGREGEKESSGKPGQRVSQSLVIEVRPKTLNTPIL